MTHSFPASVPVTIKGGPSAPEIKTLPKHKKNPEVGEKKTVYTSTVFVEQEDAASFEDQEEVRIDVIVCKWMEDDAHETPPDHPHGLGQCHRPFQDG